jgi:Zn-finger nucleic acid-binding protein
MKSRMKCPRDGSQMTLSIDQNESITHCKTCNGILIHKSNLPNQSKIKDLPTTPGINCPMCAKAMIALHHNDVEIDFCTNCELVWLDNGERKKIQSFEKSKWYDYLEAPDFSTGKSTKSDCSNDSGIFDDIDIVNAVGDILSGIFDGL